MTDGLKTTLQILLGPAVGAIVTLFVARATGGDKAQKADSLLKRVQIVEKAIAINKDRKANEDTYRQLSTEIDLIIQELRLLNITAEEQAGIEFDKRYWYKQVIHLPKPQKLGQWVATIIFYVYLPCTVLYLILPFMITGKDLWFVLLGFVASALMTLAGRTYAVRSARESAIVSRARRLLLAEGTANNGADTECTGVRGVYRGPGSDQAKELKCRSYSGKSALIIGLRRAFLSRKSRS